MSDPQPRMTGGSFPVPPDPSTLTTQQILREVAALKELVMVRLDAMDKAVEVFNENLTRVPTETQKSVTALSDLIHQRFLTQNALVEGYRLQYMEKFGDMNRVHAQQEDIRLEQKSDGQKSIDSALNATNDALRESKAAADAALAKTESGFKDQINSQYATVTATLNATTNLVNDVRTRVDKIEAVKLGAAENRSNARLDVGSLVGLVGMAIAIVSIVIVITTK